MASCTSVLNSPTRFLNLLLKFLLADSILILLCTYFCRSFVTYVVWKSSRVTEIKVYIRPQNSFTQGQLRLKFDVSNWSRVSVYIYDLISRNSSVIVGDRASEWETTRRRIFSPKFLRIRVFLPGVLPGSDILQVHESVVILMSQENQCHTPRISTNPLGNSCSIFSLLKSLDSQCSF